jgi:hypothetical protein
MYVLLNAGDIFNTKFNFLGLQFNLFLRNRICVRNEYHDFLTTMYCMLLKCILDAYSKKISQKGITYFFALLSRVSRKGNK